MVYQHAVPSYEPEYYPTGAPQIDKILSLAPPPPPSSPRHGRDPPPFQTAYVCKLKGRPFSSVATLTPSQITSFSSVAKRMLTRFAKKRAVEGAAVDTEVEPEWTLVDKVVDYRAPPDAEEGEGPLSNGQAEKDKKREADIDGYLRFVRAEVSLPTVKRRA